MEPIYQPYETFINEAYKAYGEYKKEGHENPFDLTPIVTKFFYSLRSLNLEAQHRITDEHRYQATVMERAYTSLNAFDRYSLQRLVNNTLREISYTEEIEILPPTHEG